MDELPDSLQDSMVEELDAPEEQEGREGVAARLRRRETVLGVLLLVGLLAFVTWQWRDREAKQADYHAGEAAAAADEWRAAHDAFARVPGYKDADARAVDSERMITVTAALTGVVALRPETGSSPTGLYSYSAGGWHYLPGSDVYSRVLGACSDKRLIYEGPFAGPGPSPTPDPGRLPGRRLFVADRQGNLVLASGINPNEYNAFMCANDGVWVGSSSDMQSSNGDSHSASPQLNAAFQAFGAPRPRSYSPSAMSGLGLSLLGIAPGGQHLLLADTSDLHGDNWHTHLFVYSRDKKYEQALTLRGAPATTQMSAAGSSFVVGMYEMASGTQEFTNTVYLLNPATKAPPAILLSMRVHAPTFDQHFQVQVRILDSGPRAGQILLSWADDRGRVIRIIDPAQPDRPLVDYRTGTALTGMRLLSIDPAGGGVLLGNLGELPPGAERPPLVLIDGNNRVHEVRPPLPDAENEHLVGAWVRHDRLIYGATLNNSPYYMFRSLSFSVVDTASTPEPFFVTWEPNPLWQRALVGSPWHAGSDFFVYALATGELSARSYSNSSSIPLGTNAAAFSDFDVSDAP